MGGVRTAAPSVEGFGGVVVSGEEKLAKPDQASFAVGQGRFGKPAEAMLFIDDNPANVEAAAACGWQVHHFTQASALEGDLASRGLI